MKNNFECLKQIMGVEEASEKWGHAPGTIKNMCAAGKVIAVKIGKTWVMPKDHPNPKIEKGIDKMKKVDIFAVLGKTEEDNKAMLNCYENSIEMTIDEYGRVYNEGGQYIADAEEVEAGEGIGCK